MSKKVLKNVTAAEAYLELLAERGIEYFFGNPGTDFAAIIEAFSKAKQTGLKTPVPVTVPHENVAVAMAHGHYMVSGQMQAVMLHVNVGTANGVCGLYNAARAHVPIFFSAGRTPIYENDVFGHRSFYIHWPQEMYDQAGMVREAVKWDYELRGWPQLETVVDRAITIADTQPRGPIYLTLPREALGEEIEEFNYDTDRRRLPAVPAAPAPAALEQAADWLAEAENPLVITGDFGLDRAGFEALSTLAEQYALPVVGYQTRYLAIPSTHPMNMGYQPTALLKDADVVVVLDCDVPWLLGQHQLREDARVIHIASDPLFQRLPIRGFPADLPITAASELAVPALAEALARHGGGALEARVTTRRARLAQHKAQLDAALQDKLESERDNPVPAMTWIAHCLEQVLEEDDILVMEGKLPLGYLTRTKPRTFFSNSSGGGLGWGLGAALGAKLAAPERLVVSVVGDGAYMFGCPTPAHFVARAMNLPTLTIILNNSTWGSVRRATLGIYPDGASAGDPEPALTQLAPSPEYHEVAAACGCYGEKVTDPDELPAAFERALRAVKQEGRSAVLNIITELTDAQALADTRR